MKEEFYFLIENRSIFSDDIRKVRDSSADLENFLPLYFQIDLVHVLSGRGSVLKKPVDHQGVADPEDDYYRMCYGIEIAKRVSAVRGFNIPIFYNGRSLHNQYLKQALEQGLFDYPQESFIIGEIQPENTVGQARSLAEFLERINISVIATVSSAYHLSRVARTIGQDSPTVIDTEKINIMSTKFVLFGIDRDFKRPGAKKDIEGEIAAMGRYSSGSEPSIARAQPTNTFLNTTDILFCWSLAAQKKAQKAGLCQAWSEQIVSVNNSIFKENFI